MMSSVFADGRLTVGPLTVRCALGREGVCDGGAKREGDGRTPAGVWPIRRLLWRPDRGPAPASRVPAQPIGPEDGWCDDPRDAAYNRPVSLPYPTSAEPLWREDRLYDLIVVLGHNDDPVVPGAGSAIFMHVARPDYSPTDGCIALARVDLDALVSRLAPGDCVQVLRRGANG